MNKNNIAIQGYEGSFHQEAVQRFYGKECSVICCDTFRQVIKNAVENKGCNAAVMAIENSIAGSILPNYNLIQGSNLVIVGEIYLHISQNLLVNKGINLQDIKEVHSHPMALLQCMDFLEQYPWKLTETEDTALSARHVKQRHSKHIAAVGSALAAEIYDLDVLAPDIHTLKNNYTRFLVLERPEIATPVVDADKASLIFQTDHSRGSLAKVLSCIADGGINLSKLQSMPVPGSDWLYAFHADMEFDSRQRLDEILEAILPLTVSQKLLGIYRNGR